MSAGEKQILVFSDKFHHHSYGPRHPLKVERLRLTMDLMEDYGIFDTASQPWVEARKAGEQDVLLIHSPEYLEIFKTANSGRVPSQA